MSQKSLSRWLKGILAGIGVCGAIIYLYFIPDMGKIIAAANPEYAYCYIPWLTMLWISAIPCYMVLYFGWRISSEIGKDNSFSMENARYLKFISMLAIIDSGYFFLANMIFLLLNMSHPGVFLMSLFVEFMGVSVAVAAAGLSHLVKKAADIQNENELTI